MPSTYIRLLKSRGAARDCLLERLFCPGSRLHRQAVRELADFDRQVGTWMETALAGGRFRGPAERRDLLKVLYITGESDAAHTNRAFESALAAPRKYNLIIFRDLPHIRACADRHGPGLQEACGRLSIPSPTLFPMLHAPSTATGLGLLFRILMEFGRAHQAPARPNFTFQHVDCIDIFTPPNKIQKIEIELGAARAQVEALQQLKIRLVSSKMPTRQIYQRLATRILKRIRKQYGDEAVFNARALGKTTLSEEVSAVLKLKAITLVRKIRRRS